MEIHLTLSLCQGLRAVMLISEIFWKVLLLKKFTFTNVQETEDKSD